MKFIDPKTNSKRSSLRSVIMKLPKKQRQRILRATRERKLVSYKGTPTKLSADFSAETFQARRVEYSKC